jgi:hypothetical protein
MNPATAKKHGAMLLVGAWQELGWRLAAVMGSKLKKTCGKRVSTTKKSRTGFATVLL